MTITIEQVRALRERTGAGILDTKKALEANAGDMEKAFQMLREKGLASAAKKATREAREGQILSYIHGSPGRVGVLLELSCETDFVARTDAFKELANGIAMQIAAANPQFLGETDIPADTLEHERATFRAQMADEKKPPEIKERIIDGKLAKWMDESVLLRQAYIRDNSQTVGAFNQAAIAELGENIVVRRFARYELGERA